ncbi:MAG: hypothetical protein R3211_01165 [Balneolaceae bacterium]|nr:hypothetical protein [Balneolaceae bacterium]
MKTINMLFGSVLLILFSYLLIGCTDSLTNPIENADINWETDDTIAPADDRGLTQEQRKSYRMDAEKLAVRYINDKDSTDTEIPDNLIELFYHGLVHIANFEQPAARTVTEELDIHARNPVSSREILVFADSNATWVAAWRDSLTHTGNDQIDRLTDRFNLELIAFNELKFVLPQVMATLESDRAINGYAVGRLFEEHDDIVGSHPDQFTDGNDIRVLIFDDYLFYTFIHGSGDCPSGCINKQQWDFKVFKDGTVEFAGGR